MAKFSVKIEMDDLSIVDDVSVLLPDAVIAPLIAACESLNYVDANTLPITGGRAVTYAIRMFLTNQAEKYARKKDEEIAISIGNTAALKQYLESIQVVEPEPEPQPEPQPEPTDPEGDNP